MRAIASIAVMGLVLNAATHHAYAQQGRPQSTNYTMPFDVQAVGGGEKATSTNYELDDTIGEPNIGDSQSTNYILDAGYRQGTGSALSMNCSSTAGLGTLTVSGDTSVSTCGSAGYCDTNKAVCRVTTGEAAGYSLSWLIATGTGSAGARTGTGHLNGFTAGNRIAPLGTGSTMMDMQPQPMTAGGTVTNDARWAARLSSTSTTTGGAGKTWGLDGINDLWLRIATGSSVNIASRTSPTPLAGDIQNIGFRAIIHGTATVAPDTYKATIIFTALSN